MARESKEIKLNKLLDHHTTWTDDNDKRRTRENGWNDVIDAYWGKLPENWPYLSQVVDPRIRTTILEKKARLTNSKLRGTLTPREGADVIKAKLNNTLLDFQWDNANEGGSMNSKWGTMDQDARIFASAFGEVKWKREFDDDGKLLYDGNEFIPLDINNVGIDPTCHNVRDAKWVQVREYITIQDLEDINDNPLVEGGKVYPGLGELKRKIMADKENATQDRRDTEFQSRLLQNKGLEDHTGEDREFPTVEIITEYRPDRWITFSAKHKVILRDIKNPYAHRKIPIVQLKYYPLLDDPMGESEVEIVLPLWRAIQATVCGFLDNMNIHMRPPIKVLEGAVRMETIAWGPEATWIMNRLDAVQEMSGSGEALRYFQTTYSSLVAAFNQAMGDMSQGVSSVDPFGGDKTATEVKSIAQQRNVRDQNNQLYLSDAIKDMMSMWLSNNQQFLFMDPKRREFIIRIAGKQAFDYFKRAGLDSEETTPESMQMILDILNQGNGEVSDRELREMMTAASIPKFPVVMNPNVKDPSKMEIKSKMKINDMNDMAEISLTPEDLQGTFDYVPDVKSMAAGASDEMRQARQQAMNLMLNNQQVLQLLTQEGYRPKVKELLVDILEDAGQSDADQLFESIEQGIGAGAGAQPPMAQPGLPGAPSPAAGAQAQQQLAGPVPGQPVQV